jgi:DNA-binding response OmpR family regulator
LAEKQPSIIVISGRADGSEKAHALKMGAIAVLDKSLQLDALIEAGAA